jgi:hypothetical protein
MIRVRKNDSDLEDACSVSEEYRKGKKEICIIDFRLAPHGTVSVIGCRVFDVLDQAAFKFRYYEK